MAATCKNTQAGRCKGCAESAVNLCMKKIVLNNASFYLADPRGFG